MATQGTKIAGLPFVPRKYSIVERAGKAYVTTKGHRRFKTPAKTRKRIAAGLRRMKFPMLTIAAIGIPVGTAVTQAGGLTNVFTLGGFRQFGSSLLGSYTGFNPISGTKFDIRRLGTGLAPLVALIAIRRLGVFRGVNNQLARMRIPLRLS